MIISRYLTKEVVYALLTVITVLLLAFLSQQVVRYLNYVAIGKIPTNVFLQLVSFEIPYLLALLLPLALYLGILLAYGRLYADHEMSVLQMSGFGSQRIMILTAYIASVVMGVVMILMLWVNPAISAKRQQLMASDEATLQLIKTLVPGRFQASPDGSHVMYVEKLSRDHERAENVFLAQEKAGKDPLSDQPAWMLVFATQGYQVKDKQSADQFFVTTDGYRYEGTPGQNDYKIIQFKKYAVRIPQNDNRITHVEDEALSSMELWKSHDIPARNAELQWRLSIGVSVLVLALLAVPLSAARPRQGRFLMLLPAVLVYIVYINLLFVARRWLETGTVPVFFGMWWVHAIMLVFVSMMMLIGARQWANKI